MSQFNRTTAVGKHRTCCHRAKDCIFCRIVKDAGQPESRVLYQDDRVVALPDIRPAAAVHLLVLPRAHIPTVSSLAGPDAALVRHMVAVGEQLMQQQQQQLSQPIAQSPIEYKFGFHKPPFRSVDHLHLHCFTLPHKWYRWIQYQYGLNWVSADSLLDQLSRLPSAPTNTAEGVVVARNTLTSTTAVTQELVARQARQSSQQDNSAC